MTARTGEVLVSRRVGLGINDIAASEEKGILAISVPREQKVYILNSSNLNTIKTFRVSGVPSSLWIDGDMLYITNVTTGNLEIYELKGFKAINSIYSGVKPIDVLGIDDKIYVANKGENSISVFDKEQLIVLRKIQVKGPPKDMTFCTMRRWMYVALEDKGVAVVDTIRDRVVGYIDLGCSVSALCTNPGGGGQPCW